jgi:hypothetical protein
VLRGLTPAEFLDTYMTERGPNARATVVESMRVGLYVNERDPEKVKLRDDQLLAMQAEQDRTRGDKRLIAFRVPGFTAGFIARGGWPAAGDAFPQARVGRGREGLFDDVAGRGFLILLRDGDPGSALSASDLAFWQSLGGRIVSLGGTGDDRLVDIDGHYGKVMDEYGCAAIVKRPDYHIFGAGRGVDDLPALLSDLREQLRTGKSG